jgi:hypothetical protein
MVPAEALPYVGRQRYTSLFDVTALARPDREWGGSARIPVSLTFATGTTLATPPGITVTSVSGQSAEGYLTPGDGAAFAAALREIAAYIRAGKASGTGAGGLVWI